MRKYLSTLPAFELASTLSAGSTTLTITDGGSLVPAIAAETDTITFVVEPDTENEEIVTVTVHDAGSNTFTIVRAQEETQAVGHTAGVTIKHMVTARDLQEPHQHINAKNYSQNGSKELHGLGSADGDVVGSAKAQTLTNKSLDFSTGNGNSITNIPQTSVFGLTTALAGKASTSHTHAITDITGVTATVAELNILDGLTATTAELNILDGVTATTAELNYVDGVTSNIQTQIDAIPVVSSGSRDITITNGSGSGSVNLIGCTSSTPIVATAVIGSSGTALYNIVVEPKSAQFVIYAKSIDGSTSNTTINVKWIAVV